MNDLFKIKYDKNKISEMIAKIEWTDHGDNDEHYITCITTYQSKYIISSSKNGTIIFYVLMFIVLFFKSISTLEKVFQFNQDSFC